MMLVLISSYHLWYINFNFEHFPNIIKKNDRLKHLVHTELKNKELKEYNLQHNIPESLGTIDSLFYELNKNVSVPLLDKINEEYELILSNEAKNDQKQLITNSLSDDLLEIEETNLHTSSQLLVEDPNSNGNIHSSRNVIIGESNESISLMHHQNRNIDHQSLERNIQNNGRNIIERNTEIIDFINQDNNEHNIDIFNNNIDTLDLMSLPLLRK